MCKGCVHALLCGSLLYWEHAQDNAQGTAFLPSHCGWGRALCKGCLQGFPYITPCQISADATSERCHSQKRLCVVSHHQEPGGLIKKLPSLSNHLSACTGVSTCRPLMAKRFLYDWFSVCQGWSLSWGVCRQAMHPCSSAHPYQILCCPSCRRERQPRRPPQVPPQRHLRHHKVATACMVCMWAQNDALTSAPKSVLLYAVGCRR